MRDAFVLIAAAGVVLAAGIIYQKRQQNGQTGSASALRSWISGSPDSIINNALPGQPGYGWTYYGDGIAISPEGIYYKNGAEVWRP